MRHAPPASLLQPHVPALGWVDALRDRTRTSGAAVLITGPSGAGKSTLLTQLDRALRTRAVPVARTEATPLPERPLVDLFSGPVDRAMYWLSRVGLAEAQLIARHPDQLSDGQRWRLRLGLTLAALPRHGWALADEFAAILDRPTALAVARSTAACARATGRVLVACTVREDLAPALEPDHTEHLTLPRSPGPVPERTHGTGP